MHQFPNAGSVSANDFSDLIVVIPGILGSRLVRRHGGKTVTAWDFSISALPRLLWELTTGGLVLEGNGIDPPQDDIEAAELFNFQILPGFFGVDDYSMLLESLGRSAGPGQLVTFPYDWRLSNRHAAEKLVTAAGDALRRWRTASGNAQAKLWLVCHSMGGLVARYFCEKLGGASDTRAIVTMGTPHRGSVRALEALVGLSYGPLSVTRLVRSLPSVYELLPLFPVVRPAAAVGVHRLAELFGLDPVTGDDRPPAVPGTAPTAPAPPLSEGVDRGMLQRALQFHACIRGPAERRAEDGEPSPYEQRAFFNRRQRTPLTARIAGAKLTVLDTYPERAGSSWREDDPRGDGTVPSFASVPIEWANTKDAVAVAEKHVMMPAGGSLQDTVFNWMRPLDVREKKGVSVEDVRVVELNVPPCILAGEPLVVWTAALRGVNGTIEVEHVVSGARSRQPFSLTGNGEPRPTTFPPPAPGMVRVVTRPAQAINPPVSDYVLVVDAARPDAGSR